MGRTAVAMCLVAVTFTARVSLAQAEQTLPRGRTGMAEAAAAEGRPHPQPGRWRGPKRNWGPEQAVGPADTPGSGDLTTAWASATPDGQAEWLVCEYEQPLHAIFLHVHETYNPGALVKVTALTADGKEVVAWEGEDPTPRTAARGVSKIPIALGADVQRFKLYLDSPAVRGWNEIDAVAVEDQTGKLHWAVNVQASSTFAAEVAEPPLIDEPLAPRALSPLEILQRDVLELKEREARQREDIRLLREELRQLKDLLNKPTRKPE